MEKTDKKQEKRLEEALVLVPSNETVQLVEAKACFEREGNLRNCNFDEYFDNKKLLKREGFDLVQKIFLYDIGFHLGNAIFSLQTEASLSDSLGQELAKIAGFRSISKGDFNQLDMVKKRIFENSVGKDTKEAFIFLKALYDLVKSKKQLPVNGKIGSSYASDIGFLLNLISKYKENPYGEISFGSFSIHYSIHDQWRYDNPERNLEGYGLLFAPVTAEIKVSSTGVPIFTRYIQELKSKYRIEGINVLEKRASEFFKRDSQIESNTDIVKKGLNNRAELY